MSSSKQELTVDAFLRVLGALDTNVSPVKRSTTGGPPLSVSVSRASLASATSKRSGSFAALESPSTPSALAAADGRFLPSPPLSQSPAGRPHAGSYSYAGVYRPSPASATMPTSIVTEENMPVPPPSRPTLFASRSVSAPSLPTLDSTMAAVSAAPLPNLQEASAPVQPQLPAAGSTGGGLFATSVAGMGRVALSRRSMFGQLGSAPSPSAALTSLVEPTPAMSFHQLPPPTRASPVPVVSVASGLLPAFALGAPGGMAASTTTRSRASSTSKSSSPVKPADDARLAKLRSWLDDDEDTTEEEEVRSGADATAEAEASLKASAAHGKLANSLAALDGVLGSLGAESDPAIREPNTDGTEVSAAVRVGGKNVTGLRQSQKRQLDGATQLEPDSAAKMSTRASTRASFKGKGKAAHNHCLCGEEADDQPHTIECTECRSAYHLACLDATSSHQLSAPFVCSRCAVGAPLVSPPPAEAALAAGQRTPELANKRVRIGTASTPHLLSEPTFVASTPLSAPRGDAFGPLVADLALAPSPTASPVRRFASVRAPVSPTHQRAQLPIPTTPQLGDASLRGPGDYSPTSPQNTRVRAARTRLVSNTGAAFLGGAGGADWLESWDQHQFPVADSMQAQAPSSVGMSSLAEDDWRLPPWSDVNMTPSRALSRATPATSSSSSVWDTPYAHSSPQGRRINSQGPYMLGHHTRTPSQDLLNMLDREHGSGSGSGYGSAQHHHSEPAHHMFSQRLFGGPGSAGEMPGFDSPGGGGSGGPHSMPLGHPPSPLNPRRQPSYGHARKQSLGDGLGRAPFAYPLSPVPAHPYLPPHMHGLGSVGMKPSFSAPGGRLVDLMPSLEYDEQHQLDDLLL